jgi:hypothetical protein
MPFDSRNNQMATSFQYSSLPAMQVKLQNPTQRVDLEQSDSHHHLIEN